MSKFDYHDSREGVLGSFEGAKLYHMNDGIVEVLDTAENTIAVVFLKPGESIVKQAE